MIKIFLTILLFVYSVFAASSFIGKTKRAELFEITDDKVPIIRVTIPDDEYKALKNEASKGYCLYLLDETVSLNHLRGYKDKDIIDFKKVAQVKDYDPFQQSVFETKNATMTFELDGEIESFDKIKFKLGGSASRMFGKSGYNIKIRGGENLHGRTQIKIRPDAREATFLRTKLCSDIHNRLGLPTVSTNYVELYINGEYVGFYHLEDAIKKSWIETEYGDVDTTTLYECKSTGNDMSAEVSGKKCLNENENVTDHSEFIQFLTALDNAKSPEDIEDIFDIDLFLTEMAFEYLVGSWDHLLLYGHNFFLYRPKDSKKWKFIINDFDGDIGQDISIGITGMVSDPITANDNLDYPNYTFKEWAHLPRHIVDVLIHNNSTRFDNILRKFVTDVFNPATLFPHIDELKKFIKPYVEKDKTPDKNGKLPGKNNEESGDFTMAHWDANSEFTTIRTLQNSRAYGLKYWILTKYRYICKNYDMECDPVYMDENYKYSVDKTVESPLKEDDWVVFDTKENLNNNNNNKDESNGSFTNTKNVWMNLVLVYAIHKIIKKIFML